MKNGLKFEHEALQRHLVFIFDHDDDTFHIPLPRIQSCYGETRLLKHYAAELLADGFDST